MFGLGLVPRDIISSSPKTSSPLPQRRDLAPVASIMSAESQEAQTPSDVFRSEESDQRSADAFHSVP